MTTSTAEADPIEAHIEALGAALRGPDRVKARLVGELREGLIEAAADLSPEQRPDRQSARRAVRQFGTVAEIAPSFQRELTIAQARLTARTVMFAVPFLLALWYLVEVSGGSTGRRLPHLVQLLAAHLGGTAAAAALTAAAFLAATGALARRLPTPRHAPLLVAWTGTTAAAALALSAFTLTIASVMATDWPLSAVAGVITIAFHAKIAASARACRQCARLPITTP
ncbi:permease prefix domain 1-containing protein [Actinomadura decatromicini]|uniref:Uncharacterized protein n=1 Tax=Actinomadura decatromicini TaxID=2604572 RepID=A0A5D3FIW0_9ACTN|nr:permease prefix domain 1-containing protein [Actinomadura decatromicini]TYK47235.1 hypothetical protein FXF68_25925 [Actinomadura decatromicini]